MLLDQQVRRFPAQRPGGGGGHRAAVHGVEVAPGRQRVQPPARRRAGRARGHGPPASAVSSPAPSSGPQAAHSGGDACLDLLQDGGRSRPRRGRIAPPAVPQQPLCQDAPAVPPCRRRCATAPPAAPDVPGRSPVQRPAMSQSSGSKPSSRSSASARMSEASPPVPCPRGTRASAMLRSREPAGPVGDCPKTCRPSRICASFSSHR